MTILCDMLMCSFHGKHAVTRGYCALLVLPLKRQFLDKSFLLPLPDPDHGSHQVCPEWPEYENLSLLTSTCSIWRWLPGQENAIFRSIYISYEEGKIYLWN